MNKEQTITSPNELISSLSDNYRWNRPDLLPGGQEAYRNHMRQLFDRKSIIIEYFGSKPELIMLPNKYSIRDNINFMVHNMMFTMNDAPGPNEEPEYLWFEAQNRCMKILTAGDGYSEHLWSWCFFDPAFQGSYWRTMYEELGHKLANKYKILYRQQNAKEEAKQKIKDSQLKAIVTQTALAMTEDDLRTALKVIDRRAASADMVGLQSLAIQLIEAGKITSQSLNLANPGGVTRAKERKAKVKTQQTEDQKIASLAHNLIECGDMVFDQQSSVWHYKGRFLFTFKKSPNTDSTDKLIEYIKKNGTDFESLAK